MTLPEMMESFFFETWRIFKVEAFDGITFGAFLFGTYVCILLIWFLHTFFKRES